MKFNHIDAPYEFKEFYTKYPQGYTIYEALLDWLNHVNLLTDDVNAVNDAIAGFLASFEGNLQNEVQTLISAWQVSGELDVIISEALQTQITTVSAKVDAINEVFLKASDFASLELAIAEASQRVIASPQTMYSADQSNVITLVLEKKQYNIETPIVVPANLHIRGNGAILKGADNSRIFTSEVAYRVRFDDILFHGNDVEAVYFDIPNLDMAKYEFYNCKFSTNTITPGKYAVYIKSRSARVIMEECDVITAPNYLFVDETDFCLINGGWINGWSPLSPVAYTKPENSCSIVNKSRMMSITQAVFIPEQDGSGLREKVRWIDNYGQISIDQCHFGGENAGFPIVYQYIGGANDTPPYANYADLTVTNSQVSCGASNRVDSGVVVLMPNVLPGRYHFSDLTYLISAPLIQSIHFDYAGTQDSAQALLRTLLYASSHFTRMVQMSITYQNISVFASIPACLLPWVNAKGSQTSGGVVEPATATPYIFADVLKIEAGSGVQRAGVSFDLDLSLVANNGGLPIYQQRKVKGVAFWDSGASPYVQLTTEDFLEYAPAGGAVLDTVMDVTVTGITNTKFTLTISLSNALTPSALGWSLSSIQSLGSSGASGGAIFARNY